MGQEMSQVLLSDDPFYAQLEQELSKLLLSDDDELPDDETSNEMNEDEEPEELEQPAALNQSSHDPYGSRADRTIFLSFSRGHRMSASEVMDFITSIYGDCIDEFYMQPVPPHEQTLHAVLVTRQAATVAEILDGEDKAKFVINGKHVWARLYMQASNGLPAASQPPAEAAQGH